MDSSVWIDFLRGTPTTEAAHLRQLIDEDASIGLTGIVRMELLRGVSNVGHAALTDALDQFPLITTEAVDFDSAAALYRAARDAGASVRSSVDCLIAAPCIRLGLPLLHRDADFDTLAAVSDLRIVA